jgi:hypothetical protein
MTRTNDDSLAPPACSPLRATLFAILGLAAAALILGLAMAHS